MHLRRITSIVTAAALSGALVACGSNPGPDADPANPVTIDVTVSAAAEIYSIPWLVAQQQGLFEKHGVIVENIVPGKGGSATMRTLLDGNIPIGEVSYPSIVQADAAGSELRIVGGGTQGPYPMNFYALASNPDINSIEDVRRWAYTRPNSASDALTRLIPSLAGVDPSRIERVASGGIGEGFALLEAGNVDIALVPSIVAEQRPEDFKLIVSSPDYMSRFLQSTITTTKDYAASNPRRWHRSRPIPLRPRGSTRTTPGSTWNRPPRSSSVHPLSARGAAGSIPHPSCPRRTVSRRRVAIANPISAPCSTRNSSPRGSQTTCPVTATPDIKSPPTRR